MHRNSVITLICLCCAVLCSCGKAAGQSGNAPAETTVQTVTDAQGKVIDVDLTQISSTMIYSTVSNMMQYPDSYLGQHIKLSGQFSVYHDKGGDKYIFSAIIPDATACCSQGIEFVLDGDPKYPDDYPKLDTNITVSGEFNYYKEGVNTYCQLLHAEIEDSPLSWK